MALVGVAVSAYPVLAYVALGSVVPSGGLVALPPVLDSSDARALPYTLATSAGGFLWFTVSLTLSLYQLRDPSLRLWPRLHVAWVAAGMPAVLAAAAVQRLAEGPLGGLSAAAGALVAISAVLVLTRLRALTRTSPSHAA